MRIAVVIVSLICALAPARAETPWRAQMMTRLRSDATLTRLLNVCPADAAGAGLCRHMAGVATRAACDHDAVACYEACKACDGEACLELAYALEDAEPAIPSALWKPVYTAACALGAASGCTNRAANLRNLDDPDPLDHARESPQSCEFRSFRLACEREDAWGCSMLGQSLWNGEGVPRDRARARRMFAKACSLSPTSEPCRFAHGVEAGE